VSSAVRDDMRLVAVVMGTDSDAARNEESRKLLNYGFRFFSKRTLLAGNTALQDARIWKGTVESLPVGISDDFYHVVSSDEADSASARITLTEPLIAPINAGDQIGEVSIISGEAVLAVLPLVALESVETGGLFKRLLDTIRLWF
jgi:D-alanyl-D-alanine carboxypeptidase (penicillin-binding protein 5/6)